MALIDRATALTVSHGPLARANVDRVQLPNQEKAAQMSMLDDRVDPGVDVGCELVARARHLVPLLRDIAARTDHERRVPAEILAALSRCPSVPDDGASPVRRVRGRHRTKIRVVSELARGCGSTSWLVRPSTGGSWFVGMMNERAQQDVWPGGPDAKVAVAVPPSGTAERVADGYLVSGSWHYSSGCEHADWVLLWGF